MFPASKLTAHLSSLALFYWPYSSLVYSLSCYWSIVLLFFFNSLNESVITGKLSDLVTQLLLSCWSNRNLSTGYLKVVYRLKKPQRVTMVGISKNYPKHNLASRFLPLPDLVHILPIPLPSHTSPPPCICSKGFPSLLLSPSDIS